uniref:Transmembrane protein n=1 Tax=Medicago truncatula TaxID=3880 RepID=I3SY48_MEDTR|nr:unknown [Medicago truncatula]
MFHSGHSFGNGNHIRVRSFRGSGANLLIWATFTCIRFSSRIRLRTWAMLVGILGYISVLHGSSSLVSL